MNLKLTFYFIFFFLSISCVGPSKPGIYKVTYYWTVKPTKKELSIPKKKWAPVLSSRGNTLGHAPIPLLKRLSLEGSGYLPNGKLVNLNCKCPYPNSRFLAISKKKAPWGIDAQSHPLIPYYRVAAPKDYLRPNTIIYLPRFKNLKLPNGKRHTGYFKVSDTGYSLNKAHIDIFVGSIENYRSIDAALKGRKKMRVKIVDPSQVDLTKILPSK